ncbi:MAG: integration host factor, actinobacterial type [Actinomycetota bacterium]
MAKRKKILGLPIGPQQPSLAKRLVKPGLALVGAGAAAFASMRFVRGMRSNGDPSAEARGARADLQRQLKSGTVSLEEALSRADDDEALGRTRVKILLQSLPGVGARGAVTAMDELGIAPNRRIRGLGSHQREGLIERFAEAEDADR